MNTTTIIPTQDFIIADLSDSYYDKLVIARHHDSRIGGIGHHISDSFNGQIIIDWLTCLGTRNKERFLEAHIVQGKICPNSLVHVMPMIMEDIRVLSNRTLVNHSPDSLEASILTIIEKRMLKKGFSI